MHAKTVILTAAAIIAVLIFIPTKSDKPQPRITPKAERMHKLSLLERDMMRTDRLCRAQCALDFQQVLAEIGSVGGREQVEPALKRVIQEHNHIQQLIYSKHDQTLEQGVKATGSDRSIDSWGEALQQFSQAKEAVKRGKIYESPPLQLNNTTYFVLGVPSRQSSASLVGLIRQDIIAKVKLHQRRNLRLVPFPDEHSAKLKSADSDTLRDVRVKTGDDNAGTSHYHINQVVVKFKNTPAPMQFLQIKQDLNAVHVKKLGYTYVFESKSKTAKQMMDYFHKWDIEYAEPHFFYMTNDRHANVGSFVPNDALYSEYQWNLPLVETERGWDVSRGSKNVIVAVVDTGVDPNHPDLRSHLLPGINAVDEKMTPADDVGHGTHVAGIISAVVNNERGVAGMTWHNPILPVKVLDDTGAGSTYTVAQGIIWAADHGAKVINMSLGNYTEAQFLHDAIRYAFDKDIVLIAASGNDNTEEPGYPAAYPEVLAVSAIDFDQRRALFSNFGQYIDVVAPGVSIASTFMHNQYAALSGTSMASPHVTALAALIRSVNPRLKNTEVMDIIRQTARDLGAPGRDKYYGYGQIDVVRALERARGNEQGLANFWSRLFRRF